MEGVLRRIIELEGRVKKLEGLLGKMEEVGRATWPQDRLEEAIERVDGLHRQYEHDLLRVQGWMKHYDRQLEEVRSKMASANEEPTP